MTRREPELHDLDPTGRFTDVAADYVKHRPGYPAAAIDAVLAGLGEPASLEAADVGAGTGISARLLAARGVRVFAVEPNAAMRDAAEPNPNVTWRDGTAEATGLGESSVGLVLCAQSFHWFRAPEALVEFHRVLRPAGRLALLWNNRDDEDPFTRGYIEAIRAVGGDHVAEMRAFDPGVIARAGLFAPAAIQAWPSEQALDREGLRGRALSASYVPREPSARAALGALLDGLFERHRDADGLVRLRYRTTLYRSEAARRSV